MAGRCGLRHQLLWRRHQKRLPGCFGSRSCTMGDVWLSMRRSIPDGLPMSIARFPSSMSGGAIHSKLPWLTKRLGNGPGQTAGLMCRSGPGCQSVSRPRSLLCALLIRLSRKIPCLVARSLDRVAQRGFAFPAERILSIRCCAALIPSTHSFTATVSTFPAMIGSASTF